MEFALPLEANVAVKMGDVLALKMIFNYNDKGKIMSIFEQIKLDDISAKGSYGIG